MTKSEAINDEVNITWNNDGASKGEATCGAKKRCNEVIRLCRRRGWEDSAIP